MGAWVVRHTVKDQVMPGTLRFSDQKVAHAAFLEEMKEYTDRHDAETYGQVDPNVGLTCDRLNLLERYCGDVQPGDGEDAFMLADGVQDEVLWLLQWWEDAQPIDDNDMDQVELALIAEGIQIPANA